MEPTTDRLLLRHAVATLAFRASKALSDAPEGFGDFRACEGSRSGLELLSHLVNLVSWTRSLVAGGERPAAVELDDWDHGVGRFMRALRSLDETLAADMPIGASPLRLFQGPISDSFTHVGQLAMMRRMAGKPTAKVNYFTADIDTRTLANEEKA